MQAVLVIMIIVVCGVISAKQKSARKLLDHTRQAQQAHSVNEH
ncbi:hypothetical protein [Undibacterium flavidum]|nr:hypothetical protein [Undibacterium flavidum]